MEFNESILNSVKEFLPLSKECTSFDNTLIMLINTEFETLRQLGVGPKSGFIIKDEKTTWEEFIEDEILYNSARSYVCMRVKLKFDPPTNSSLIDSMNRSISEIEWRLNEIYEAEKGIVEEVQNENS